MEGQEFREATFFFFRWPVLNFSILHARVVGEQKRVTNFANPPFFSKASVVNCSELYVVS